MAPRAVSDWWLDQLTLAILALAPLLMGGRQPLGRFVYVLLVASLVLLWVMVEVHRRWLSYRPLRLEWCMLAATILIMLQCIPLPWQVLTWASPRIASLLPLWHPGQSSPDFGPWRTLSLSPQATRIGLTVWLAHCGLLIVLFQRLHTRQDIVRLLRAVAVSGVLMAVVGVLQYVFSNGRFLWIYENPYRSTRDVVTGTFYNANHCAHLLTLAMIPLWIWVRDRWQTRQLDSRVAFASQSRRSAYDDLSYYLLIIAVPTLAFALLMTQSRGGMLTALLVATIACGAAVRRDGVRRSQFAVLCLMLGALLLVLTVHGWEQVRSEVNTMASASLDQWDQHAGRRNLWNAARGVIGQFTLVGAGAGSFRDLFPLYFSEPREHEYSYAESGYLQIVSDTGVAGMLLLTAALVILFRRLMPLWHISPRHADRDFVVAAIGGLAASLFHSIFDFVWFLPACFALTMALLAVALRLAELHAKPPETSTWTVVFRSPLHSLALVLPLVIVAVGLVRVNWGPACGGGSWNRYLIALRDHANEHPSLTATANTKSLRQWRAWLIRVVDDDPGHVRARLHLAAVELQLFDRLQAESEIPMSLVQIRDAAIASHFPSTTAQDRWLRIVTEGRREHLDSALEHCWAALRSSPLQGTAYVYLGELSFLEHPGQSLHIPLLQQALRVRPHAANVLFAAGREAILVGDVARALQYWRRAYHQDSEHRDAITEQIASILPAPVFVEQFRPTPYDLHRLYQHYQRLQMHAQARVAGVKLIETAIAQPAATADPYLYELAYSIAAAQQDRRALALAKLAVDLDPVNETMRRRLAMEYLSRRAWEEAIPHLQQCLDWNPADATLHKKLAMAQQQVSPTSSLR